MMSGAKTGVVLMSYGSPRDLDDVGAYITRVRGGREPSPDLLAEFRRRYERIGMSPLIDITRQQADGLQSALGDDFVVETGMRFSEPSIATAIQRLRARGVQRLLGLILSPQYSPILMGGYVQTLESAADGLPTRVVDSWHLNPAVIDVLAARIRAALARFPLARRKKVPVLLTAHSLPKRVVDREPDYLEQLKDTAQAVAAAADLAPERWSFVYQSAGHTPEEWLKPDMLDVLPQLAAAGHREVVVAPVQFLADHLETLYDVDVAGREQALAAGFESFARVPAPNASPDFIAALVSVVRGELVAWDSAKRGAAWSIA
jgi:protoporphyrin/coproporphyrin ferrochelatase